MKIEKINAAQSCYNPPRVSPGASCAANQKHQIDDIANVYYKPISFGRTAKEHKSWGAAVDCETKKVSFKILTYPDAKSVSAVVKSADSDDVYRFKLKNKGQGIFETNNISPDMVKPGDSYQYEITKANDEIITIKDPYSFCQKELNGPSIIYDQSAFNWQNDKQWKNNPARIKRGDNSLQNARIYALNPDTLTSKRSYEGVKPKLKRIKKDGFNAVEIMHIENTYKYNWGYDGVDKLAPSDYLGGPDKLKELVDKCHEEGLNVIFDVVPNHIGPDGNQLGKSGPYVKGPNDFGDAINYEGKNSEYVRDWIINAMLNWAENYHVDGLRLDMTKYMESDYTLKQLAAEMNYHHPDVFLIAEDGRRGIDVDGIGNYWSDSKQPHDKRVTSGLLKEEYGAGESQQVHAGKIKEIINKDTNISRLGMNSEWDFNYFHKLDAMLYGGNTNELMDAIINSQNNVKYVMSHDEIGNFEGSRKISKLMVPKLMLNDNVSLSQEDIKRAREYSKLKNVSFENALYIITCQKAQLVAEELAIKLQTGELEQYKAAPADGPAKERELNDRLYMEILSPLGISNPYTYSKITNAFEKAYEQTKQAQALTFLIPGPKMVFQGDENSDLTPFRFFRQFESIPNENYLFTEKGYPYGESALNASTLGKIKYSKQGALKMRNHKNLTRDLNKLNNENPALTKGKIDQTTIVSHPISRVIGFCTKDDESNNEIFTVANFSGTNYRHNKDNEYYIKFPEGKWVEVLNTDNTKYGGCGRHANEDIIEGDGNTNRSINLSRYSTCCFKRVG